MDVKKIVAQLRGELDLIEKTIASIENLGRKAKRGSGRPMGLVTKSNQNETMKGSSRQSGDQDR